MIDRNSYIEMTENDYDARELLEPLYEEAIEKTKDLVSD